MYTLPEVSSTRLKCRNRAPSLLQQRRRWISNIHTARRAFYSIKVPQLGSQSFYSNDVDGYIYIQTARSEFYSIKMPQLGSQSFTATTQMDIYTYTLPEVSSTLLRCRNWVPSLLQQRRRWIYIHTHCQK